MGSEHAQEAIAMSDNSAEAVNAIHTVQETPAVETFSKEYVQELRSEAAKYRNEKKDAVEAAKAKADAESEAKVQAAEAKTTEVTESLGNAWIELQKLHTAIELGVPSDKVLAFVEVLKGTDEVSIKESAESAKALFGGFDTSDPAVDPTQGQGGKPLPLNGDPLLHALKKAVGA